MINKKVLLISSILALSTMAMAENKAIKLDESVITTQNTEKTVRDTAANVTIITAQQIEDSGATNLIDALRMAPGIIAKNYYGDIAFDIGGYSSVHAERNNIITVDGVKVSKTNASMVPISSIERIEVIPNGGGVLYGDGACGGVINIITKNMYGLSGDKKIAGNVGFELANRRSYRYNLSTAIAPTDNFTMRVDYSDRHLISARRPKNGDKLTSKYETVAVAGNYKTTENDLLVKFTRDERVLADGGDLPEKDYKKDTKLALDPWESRFLSEDVYARYKTNIADNIEVLTYADFLKNTYKRKDKTIKSIDYDRTVKGQVKYNYTDDSYVIIGADHRDTVSKPYSDGHKNGKNTRKKETGIFAMNETTYGNFVFAQGLRFGMTKYDYYWRNKFPVPTDLYNKKASQKFNNYAFDLETRYNYSDTGMTYAKISRSFRTPINREIYYTVNADKLKSQIQHIFEIGAKDYIGDNVFVSASAFVKRTEGEIYYQGTRIVNPATGKAKTYFPYYNMGDTRRIGVELLSEQYLGDFTFTESLTYLHHKIVKSDFEERKNKQIPFVPNWKAGFGTNYKVTDALSLDANVLYIGKYFDSDDPTNKREKNCGGYTTLDLSANYQFDNGLSLTARLNNAFDKKYEDYVGYWDDTRQYSPAIGRNYSIGFNYKF